MIQEIAILAGGYREEKFKGSIILATARVGSQSIITGDKHFSPLFGVVFIEH